MTCYLRLHEVAVAVPAADPATSWDKALGAWRAATGADGRDLAIEASGLEGIHLDDLPGANLDGTAALILAGRVDQRLLERCRPRIREFLDGGRVVVFSGLIVSDWLPGASLFADGGDDTGTWHPTEAAGPILGEIDPDTLGETFVNRFGHHPPTEGATVLVELDDGRPALYVDRTSTGGTVMVHSGHDLLAYATHEGPAADIVPALVGWARRSGLNAAGAAG